ncbi:MAG: 2-amino-4-hydroxy-6-hydroxymethyldihydropteridine diphosphokinase [Gammaproteobacteria bacterium]|nr:2-amino-4-hydroxy-6-hydroxymethyldihydropteridine diphosphokinase [Gammaproteobacteria bacterium]MCW8888589.1 2-amino-4-hydroxy-6-hydroxymethyldihydropteridine diphosphokinase [Gammaproteobacteria bacterium]
MATVFLSLGSNIDKEVNIQAGIDALEQHFGKVICSTVYESESVGFDGDNFYNLVVQLETDETVDSVVTTLKQIEDEHGRTRSGPRFSSRTLDIDILLYDDLIRDDELLSVPRDEILKNAFVLKPLAELAGEIRHPQTGDSYADLWRRFDQSSQPLWPISMK